MIVVIASVFGAGVLYLVVRELISMFTPIHCPKCGGTQHEASILRPRILICRKCRTEHLMPVE